MSEVHCVDLGEQFEEIKDILKINDLYQRESVSDQPFARKKYRSMMRAKGRKYCDYKRHVNYAQ